MPFSISNADGITVIELSGSISGQGLMEAARAVFDQPAFDPAQPRIWDLRGVSEMVLDFEKIDEVRNTIEEHVPKVDTVGRVAVVALRDVDRIVASLFRTLLRYRPFEVFDSMAAAKAWIRQA